MVNHSELSAFNSRVDSAFWRCVLIECFVFLEGDCELLFHPGGHFAQDAPCDRFWYPELLRCGQYSDLRHVTKSPGTQQRKAIGTWVRLPFSAANDQIHRLRDTP